MFAKSVIALATVASFAVAAPVEKRGAPAGWAYGYLEDYQTYHVRYLALKCYEHHDTDFFQSCCRPMLSTENLKDNRASYCVPSKEDTAYVVSSLSAQAAGGAATSTASADKEVESEYCESEESASVASAPVTSSWVAASTSAAAASASPAAQSKAAVEYIAPAPSSSSTTSSTPAWTPAPTTSTTPAWTPAPQPTTTQQAQPQQNNNNGQSFNGGYATFFYQGGNAGACGQVHSDWDMIVAIDHEKWGSASFGSGSDTCGRWLTVTNTQNGKSVVAMVADVCPTCANGNSLDLSQGAFNAIASESQGQVPISWHWN